MAVINRTMVVRRGSWTEAELTVALAVVCSAAREREKEKWMASRSGRRAASSGGHRQRRQASHGTWPRGQTAGDGCPHASADF